MLHKIIVMEQKHKPEILYKILIVLITLSILSHFMQFSYANKMKKENEKLILKNDSIISVNIILKKKIEIIGATEKSLSINTLK